MKTLILTIVLTALPNAVNAAGTITGYIKSVMVKENGAVLIQYEQNHETACENKSTIVIKNDSPIKSEALSVLLSAHASHKKAAIYTTGECYEKWHSSYPIGITAAILWD